MIRSTATLSVTIAALVAGIVSIAPAARAYDAKAHVANPQCAAQMKEIPKPAPPPPPAPKPAAKK